jgi:hypothetical protein
MRCIECQSSRLKDICVPLEYACAFFASDTINMEVNTGRGLRVLWPEQANCWAVKPQYKHRSAPECGHVKPNTLMDTKDVVRHSVKCFVFFEVFICLFCNAAYM